MSVLQDRCVRDREEMASWARAMAADAESEIKRRAGNLFDFIEKKMQLFFDQ